MNAVDPDDLVPIGSKRRAHGYTIIKTERGWRPEHREVVGLADDDPRVAHHVNRDKNDNRLENLEVLHHWEHTLRHATDSGVRAPK